jgi:diguanylate cyclase (GGDEF)-like protein
MPVTLTGRFMALTIAITIAGVALAGTLSYSHNILEARQAARDAALARAHTVIDATETAATAESLARFIFSTAAQPSIDAIALIGPDSRVVVASRRAWQDRRIASIRDAPLADWLNAGADSAGTRTFWDEGFARAVAVAPLDPVNPASSLVQSIGGGQVVLSLAGRGYLDAAWSDVWFDVLWVGGFLILAMALLTGIFQWRVVSALETLYNRARQQTPPTGRRRHLRRSTPMEIKTLGTAIDDLDRTRAALSAEKQRLSNVSDTIPGAIYEYRHHPENEDTFTYASAGIRSLIGLPSECRDDEVLRYLNEQLPSIILPEDLAVIGEATERANTPTPGEWQAEFRVRTDRGVRWIWGHAMPVMDDRPGQLFCGVLLDVTARKTLEQQLERAATLDSLTGALNRAGVTPQLETHVAAAQRDREALSVVMFDIDRFKAVNDTFGHALGDAVLQRVVALATDRLRGADSLARWGGEEFLIVLPRTGLDGAVQVGETIRETIAEAVFPHGQALAISAGVAELADGEDLDALLQRVDDRLYRAKALGRNRVVSTLGDHEAIDSHH